MNERNGSLCEKLMDYAAGEGTETERRQFEKHMENCPSCADEAEAYREVWDRLAEEGIEPVEPPADLKAVVMRAAFAADVREAEGYSKKNDGTLGLGGARKPAQPSDRRNTSLTADGGRPFTLVDRPPVRRRNWMMLGTAALMVLVFAGGWFARGLTGPVAIDGPIPSTVAESRIETLYPLSAVRGSGQFAAGSRAYGVACLVRAGDGVRLVVYVFGSPQTVGEQRYQVWLLRDGERSSAGAFTVGEAGIGLLTLPLDSTAAPFDAVGITLEPEAGSESPRGPKMFGSGEAVHAQDV